MDKYFKQLTTQIDMLDPNQFNKSPMRDFLGQAFYYNINNQTYTDYLMSKFKDLNPHDVFWCEFPGARPHIDHDGFQCGINHYYNTEQAATVYYTPKENMLPYVGDGESTANFYKREDISEVARFIAEPNSVWLLKVDEIHSVDLPQWDSGIRTFVKWRFYEPYEVIYKKLFGTDPE